ncbi:hypothetical protein Y032_0001g319 [Ancylostoma ceylanicum]|uniref:Uncharacterized protein n=1 Tax=Ancylostoma ceylanicum TaxID=53326 RepID=A0A016W309_9BILA|nr:hypothetical protein Y032_0001g319 [Ancylostoma ceylanicum]
MFITIDSEYLTNADVMLIVPMLTARRHRTSGPDSLAIPYHSIEWKILRNYRAFNLDACDSRASHAYVCSFAKDT